LWHYVTDEVYKSIPNKIEDIKQAIQESFENDPIEMYKNAMYGFLDRLQLCIKLDGRHVENT